VRFGSSSSFAASTTLTTRPEGGPPGHRKVIDLDWDGAVVLEVLRYAEVLRGRTPVSAAAMRHSNRSRRSSGARCKRLVVFAGRQTAIARSSRGGWRPLRAVAAISGIRLVFPGPRLLTVTITEAGFERPAHFDSVAL
jgi:hypothetical protein